MAYASFYGLEIAKKGLFVSQQGLNLTGHNISNANTEGYTRQRIVAQSIDPASAQARFAVLGQSMVGGGVEVQSIDRIRSSFVDRELRKEYADYGQLNTRFDALDYIDSLFNEATSTSISTTLAKFFDAMNELSNDAASLEMRANVRATGRALTDSINYFYNKLIELQKQQNDNMGETVDNINDLCSAITSYNKSIFTYELGGGKANDLRDKRDVCLDQLAQLVDIEYYEDTNGQLHVTCGSQELVNHITANKLVARPDYTCPVTGETGYYTICFDDGTQPNVNLLPALNYKSGELAGYKYMRDGDANDNYGIPYVIEQLNTLCRSLATEFNAVHKNGYTLPDASGVSHTGYNFFWDGGGDINNVNAGNFRMSDEVNNDYRNIAASSLELDAAGKENGEWGNNLIALDMVALVTNTKLATVGSFEGYLKSALVQIGTEGGHVKRLAESQTSVLYNLESRKESISGVSIDEEVTMLIQYQHMYAASSRMITAIDEALDKLINHTGVVGMA